MRALSNPEVANYLNQHFVCSFQKVGNFRIVNGQKQGGNVASYFTLDDGKVLHVVAGPVDAGTLLREARWVVETRKLAIMTSHGNQGRYRASWGKAHADRLQAEYGVATNLKKAGAAGSSDYYAVHWKGHGLTAQGKVHMLLANNPLARSTRSIAWCLRISCVKELPLCRWLGRLLLQATLVRPAFPWYFVSRSPQPISWTFHQS